MSRLRGTTIQHKEFNCAIVVVMIPSNTSQFQYFWDFNKWMSPSNLFLVKFLKFLAISFGWGCYD